jgi:hypothetical protein
MPNRFRPPLRAKKRSVLCWLEAVVIVPFYAFLVSRESCLLGIIRERPAHRKDHLEAFDSVTS